MGVIVSVGARMVVYCVVRGPLRLNYWYDKFPVRHAESQDEFDSVLYGENPHAMQLSADLFFKKFYPGLEKGWTWTHVWPINKSPGENYGLCTWVDSGKKVDLKMKMPKRLAERL